MCRGWRREQVSCPVWRRLRARDRLPKRWTNASRRLRQGTREGGLLARDWDLARSTVASHLHQQEEGQSPLQLGGAPPARAALQYQFRPANDNLLSAPGRRGVRYQPSLSQGVHEISTELDCQSKVREGHPGTARPQ